MERVHLPAGSALLAALLLVPAAARGEEFVLKTGEKVVGTIVGYEGDMFKVETEFGFALIRKDKVEAIRFSSDGSTRAAVPQGEKAEPAKSPAQRVIPKLPAAPAASREATAPPPTRFSPVATPPLAPLAATPPPPSRPLNQPPPAQIREHLEGNRYVNETFRFSMYRPPGWRIYEGVARATGRAIAAIGTEDEHTLLVVDRQVWSGSPNVDSDEVESLLRQSYQEYLQISKAAVQLDGRPAVRRTFSGVMDGVEWHGVSVHVARDNTLFGLIGLTSTETHQFHQAVLNKIIDSFEFLPAPSQTAGR